MSEERDENLTVEEIQQRLRVGYQFYPTQLGLQQAARELIRPIVEKMDGQEIIYVCRVPRLMRVDYLETDDEGFRAVSTPTHDLGCRIPTIAEFVARQKAAKAGLPPPELPPDTKPLNFGARWFSLRLSGSAICMNMLTDHFYTDAALVAEVKAAVARHAFGEISAILERPAIKQ